jgi:DNA-binding CsgD family transcriptional regulator
MANTASAILWPHTPNATSRPVGAESEWTFYSQVSVSGPSVCTTVHRGESVRGAKASLTLYEEPELSSVPDDDYGDPDVSASHRDDEVLQLLAEGATNGEISQRLYISPKTTKNHLAAIFQKLDVTNRTHALVRAVVMGLVTIE